jgi:hypothetical protein
MQYQYVVMKDDETQEVELIGRFENGIPEILSDGKWELCGTLYSFQMDGMLDEISEAEALKIIAQREELQLQAA